MRCRGRRQHSLDSAAVTLLSLIAGSIVFGSSSVLAAAPALPVVPSTAEIVSGDAVDVGRPSISGDGRWVVFESDLDGRTTVYRTDRSTGVTVELTPVPPGVRSGDSVAPVLSADGCVVVVQTELALDLFRDDDTGERWDVYRTVVPECGGEVDRWELVSTDGTSGTARDDIDVSTPATLNESGSLMAFTHPVPGRRDGIVTVSVVDLTVPLGDLGRVTELPAMPVEAPTSGYRYRGAFAPALSGDGRHLAFVSDATSDAPLPEWGSGPAPGEWATHQVYVWDREHLGGVGSVRLVSGRDGQPATDGAGAPAISRDGSVVVFESTDRGLVDADHPRCDHDCPVQIYRSETMPDDTGTTLTLVSARTDGSGLPEAGRASSWSPTLDVDGSQVGFVTRAPNLLPTSVGRAGAETDGDIVIAEIPLGELRRATDAAGLGAIPAAHDHPALSATGRVIVFATAVAAAFSPDGAEGRQVVAVVSPPALSIAQLDFGTVRPGFESDELWVSVLNQGPGAFAPAAVSSTSPDFRVVDGGTCTRGLIVPAGDSCTVYVAFTPAALGDVTATLVVSEDADSFPPSDLVAVSTQLAGQGGEPVLRSEPAGLDLGSARVGSPGERRAFDVRNVSFVPTWIDTVTIAGEHPADFMITAESCTDRALNPSATCGVEIEFAPVMAQRRSASLVVTTVFGEYTAAIVGGVGRFDPLMELAESSVAVGGRLGLGLAGFPADAEVTLSFQDSTGSLATVRTGDAGELLVVVDVPRRERGGDRILVATGPYGVVASVPVYVERSDSAVPGLPGHGSG